MATTAWHTWDGLPVVPDEPKGAAILVRSAGNYLILHRAHHGPAYEGDWAGRHHPARGCRGEPVLAAAVREVGEETGLAAAGGLVPGEQMVVPGEPGRERLCVLDRATFFGWRVRLARAAGACGWHVRLARGSHVRLVIASTPVPAILVWQTMRGEARTDAHGTVDAAL